MWHTHSSLTLTVLRAGLVPKLGALHSRTQPLACSTPTGHAGSSAAPVHEPGALHVHVWFFCSPQCHTRPLDGFLLSHTLFHQRPTQDPHKTLTLCFTIDSRSVVPFFLHQRDSPTLGEVTFYIRRPSSGMFQAKNLEDSLTWRFC